MKFGIYYPYWTERWRDDFFPYIKKSHELGFDAIEINGGYIADIEKTELQNIREEIQKFSLETTYCYGLPPDMDIASSSIEKQMKGKDILKHIIDTIAYMGGGTLGGLIHAGWNVRINDIEEKNKARDISLKNFSIICDYAQKANVTLCVESVNRFEQFIINTAQEGIEYLKVLNKENVKLHLDTFHMNIEETSLEEGFYIAKEYLGHVHIGENNRTPPGGGHLNWANIVSTLHRIEYEGIVVMEPFITCGNPIANDVALWRSIFQNKENKDELLKNSLLYLKHLDVLWRLANKY